MTYRVRRKSPETFVFWLHASSATRPEQSIRSTLEQLQDPGIIDLTANVFQLFRAWLLDRKKRRRWLIVLDNADDAQSLLQSPVAIANLRRRDRRRQPDSSERFCDYLPVCEHGALLVTSRSRSAALQIVSSDDILNVCPMDERQAITLLQQKLGTHIEPTLDELSQLVKELDSMPLAMAQAAAYIRESVSRCSVRQYLDKLTNQDSRLDVLGKVTPDLRRDHNAQNCIMKTWHISFDHIRRQRSSAADLLSLMSFFDRHTIPEALLYNRSRTEGTLKLLFNEMGLTKAFSFIKGRVVRYGSLMMDDGKQLTADVVATRSHDDDVQLLRDYSFITIVGKSSSFGMHRLVQLATQNWLKTNDSFECWANRFVANLDEAFPIVKSESEDICLPLFSHVPPAMEVELRCRHAKSKRTSLLMKAGRYAHLIGAYADSQKMLEQALVCADDFGIELRCMRDLSSVYSRMGQDEKAETMQIDVLNGARSVYEADHPFVLSCMRCLAETQSKLGKLIEAEAMQTEVLRETREEYGEDHFQTMVSISSLAFTLSMRGRYLEAGVLRNEALSIARKLYPAQHPEVLGQLHGQATTYYDASRYEDARRVLHDVLPQSVELQGGDHPDTLTSMYWLSRTTYKLGQRRPAIDLLRDCAEKSERKLGPHHPVVVERYKLLRDWEVEDELQGDAEEIEERPSGTEDQNDVM
jgi:tetratricopeptide (TPR) repeat protein